MPGSPVATRKERWSSMSSPEQAGLAIAGAVLDAGHQLIATAG